MVCGRWEQEPRSVLRETPREQSQGGQRQEESGRILFEKLSQGRTGFHREARELLLSGETILTKCYH